MNVTKGKSISAKYSFNGQDNGFKLSADCESREGRLAVVENGIIVNAENVQVGTFNRYDQTLTSNFYDSSQAVPAISAITGFITAVEEQFAAELATK